jgi:hypothetical protein
MKQHTVTLFCFFLLLSNSASYSQSLLWAKQLSGTSWKNVNDMTVDKDGNVYSTGIFQDVVDFDPGPATFNLNTIVEIYSLANLIHQAILFGQKKWVDLR